MSDVEKGLCKQTGRPPQRIEDGGLHCQGESFGVVTSEEPERDWYNAEMFWEQIEESKGKPLKGTLVAQYNRFLGELRWGDHKDEQTRIAMGRIVRLLSKGGGPLSQSVSERDFVEAAKKDVRSVEPFFQTFLKRLENEQSWGQEIPLIVELLLFGATKPELRNVYQGSVGKDNKQEEINAALLEVFDLMVDRGVLPDPLDPRI